MSVSKQLQSSKKIFFCGQRNLLAKILVFIDGKWGYMAFFMEIETSARGSLKTYPYFKPENLMDLQNFPVSLNCVHYVNILYSLFSAY